MDQYDVQADANITFTATNYDSDNYNVYKSLLGLKMLGNKRGSDNSGRVPSFI